MEDDRDLTEASDASRRASVGPSPFGGDGPTYPFQLGRYRVLGELGRGGMGVVFLGEDPDLAREVAIKILPPHLSASPESYQRFQREARLLAALNHPNVATIHSLEVVEGSPLLTMERIRGRTLAARLAGGALPVAEVLQIGAKVARAVEAAHDRGVIHRDLKPGNVMIRDDEEVKVLDFGLAKEASTSFPSLPPAGGRERMAGDPADPGDQTEITAASSDPGTSFAGTAGYMSPEQIRGLSVDPRTDLFAFGCILFECLTGTRAFGGDTARDRVRATLNQAPSLVQLPPALSDSMRDLITRCLEKDPAERPESSQAVRRVLEENLERSRFRHRTGRLRSEDLHTSGESPNNLPHALSSFVGRTEELRAVRELLESHALVTLTGAGGAGKTRLAIEVARAALRAGAPGGIWLVELAPLSDAELLEKTVMTAMGIAEQADRSPRESILERLEPLAALLVLDNCEHLVDAAADFVRAIQRRCRRVQVLVTSREPLGLEQERRFPVPPLSGRTLAEESAQAARNSEAVTLFVERARQVQPAFELTDSNLEAVVGICRRLDGLPLALELAASRIRVLEPSALLARLDDRFRLLTGGSRERLPHHRTLSASLEWSHEQLGEPERLLYRRLGVFAGGFTLESAEEVCVDPKLEAWSVLDSLTSLIDKSLVELDFQRQEAGHLAPRYRLLETFREYANHQLQAAAEGPATRAGLVSYLQRVIQDAVGRMNGPDAKNALERLDGEYGNIREAVRIALTETADPEAALMLTGHLVRYWMRRSHWSEGLGFLARALSRPGAEASTAARAIALNSMGTLEYLSGRYVPAIGHLSEASQLFTGLDMKGEAGRARMGLGNTYAFLGRWEEALGEHDTVLAIAREIDDTWLTAAALVNLCNVHEALDNLDRVDESAREAVALMERIGDRSNLLMAQNYVAAVAYRQERWEEALVIYEKGVAIATEHGDRYSIGFQRLHAGLCRTSLGRYEEAIADYLVALETAHEFDEPNLLGTTLEACGHHWSQTEEPERAVLVFSLSAQMRSERSAALRDTNVAGVEAAYRELRVRLGEERYRELEQEGRAMTVTDFIGQIKGSLGA